MTDNQVVWLTEESYDRLKTELDQLIANRPVIAAEINDRREEGDLRRTAATTPPASSRARRRGPHPATPGAAEHRQGRQAPKAVRCRAARFGGQGVLRRRRVRFRDLPDRHPPGDHQRRQVGGVLPNSRWAPLCSTPRSARPAPTPCPTAAV